MAITIKGLENINRIFRNIQIFAKNPKNILGEHIARPIYNEVVKAYEAESDLVTGVKWKKLSDVTLKAKKGKGIILYHQGTLQDRTAWDVKDNTAFIGTNAAAKGYAYPAVHQFGSNSKKITKRRFLPITDEGALSDKLVVLIENALNKKFESLLH
ncbi:MAG: phage virion morphogenesis protein [Campylobacteraceae bacterium]|jgi:phage gpG-like protein|nr:phage virion morphogenesis protein [Campylobacteraceae bacterium]